MEEIKTKEDLFKVLKDLQAKNSELSERLDTMQNPKKETEEETPEETPEEEEERTEEELDEIENMLKE